MVFNATDNRHWTGSGESIAKVPGGEENLSGGKTLISLQRQVIISDQEDHKPCHSLCPRGAHSQALSSFYLSKELLEVKRVQIRAGRANEAVS